MAIWGSAIGAAAGIAGGIISGKAKKKAAKKAAAAAAFRPGSTTGLYGNTTFQKDALTGQWNLSIIPAAAENNIRQSLMDTALSEVQGGQFAPVSQELTTQGGNDMLRMYNEFQGLDPRLAEQAYASGDEFGQFADFANAAGMAGILQGFSGPSTIDASNNALSMGQSLLNTAGTPSFNQLAAERLSSLRGLARPQEERLVDQQMNNLFARGRLGTTGGAQMMGQLSEALGREDLARINASQDFAQAQLNAERQFMQQQQGLGSQLYQLGLQGLSQEQMNALRQGEFGQALATMGQQGLQAQLGAYGMGDESALSRGQQRLAAAQQIFNFGDTINASQLGRGLQRLGGAQSIDQTLLDHARVGASVGQAQAAAGANAGALMMKGSGSLLGGALSGVGTGLMTDAGKQGSLGNSFGTWFGNLFKPKPTSTSGGTA